MYLAQQNISAANISWKQTLIHETKLWEYLWGLAAQQTESYKAFGVLSHFYILALVSDNKKKTTMCLFK